jgi:hypothetical protein
MLAVSGIATSIASTNALLARDEINGSGTSGSRTVSDYGFAAGLGEIYDATLVQQAYARAVGGRQLSVLHDFLTKDLAGDGPESLKLSLSTVNALSGIVFNLPRYEQQFGPQDRELKLGIERLIRRAPRRSDIAIPYFNYLLSHGREAEILDLSSLILARRTRDPVALWFSGVVQLGAVATSASGMQKLKQSLQLGIRNLMPVDAEMVQAIEQ